MVLADNVAEGGSMAEKIQRGETRFSGAQENRKEVKALCNAYSHNLCGRIIP